MYILTLKTLVYQGLREASVARGADQVMANPGTENVLTSSTGEHLFGYEDGIELEHCLTFHISFFYVVLPDDILQGIENLLDYNFN